MEFKPVGTVEASVPVEAEPEAKDAVAVEIPPETV